MSSARGERIGKERVIMVAAEIADRDGLEQLSLNILAATLGIKPPSLYTHISSLSGLSRLLGLRGLRDLNEWIGRAALGKSSRDAAWAVAVSYRSFIHEHPGIYAATLPAGDIDDQEWREAKDKIMETIGIALSGFDLGENEQIHVVRGLRSLIHGFTIMEMSHSFRSHVSLDESFARVHTIFLNGLLLDTNSQQKP